MVPNPAKKTAAATVKTAKKALAAAGAARAQKLAALRSPAPGTAAVITNQMLARLDAPSPPPAASSKPPRPPPGPSPRRSRSPSTTPDMVKLDTETKLITHAIRMAACNAETILARALNSHYARAGDEAYALIREALTTSGDITLRGSVLNVRLDPLSAPRRTRALAALCEQLNTASHPLPRHPAHPALRGQRTPRHCMNLLRHVRSPGGMIRHDDLFLRTLCGNYILSRNRSSFMWARRRSG